MCQIERNLFKLAWNRRRRRCWWWWWWRWREQLQQRHRYACTNYTGMIVRINPRVRQKKERNKQTKAIEMHMEYHTKLANMVAVSSSSSPFQTPSNFFVFFYFLLLRCEIYRWKTNGTREYVCMCMPSCRVHAIRYKQHTQNDTYIYINWVFMFLSSVYLICHCQFFFLTRVCVRVAFPFAFLSLYAQCSTHTFFLWKKKQYSTRTIRISFPPAKWKARHFVWCSIAMATEGKFLSFVNEVPKFKER